MTMPPYWQEACDYLSARDETMAGFIADYPGEGMRHYDNAFHTLARAIVGQQISVKAADAVWGRYADLLGELSPDAMLAQSEAELKACGLSNQKVKYLTNIAHAFTDGTLTPNDWNGMDDEAVAKQLEKIKGVGRWTAEMFLIFYLHRPDIFPLADLGLVKAVEIHYAAGEKLSKDQLLAHGEPWRPYRTVATWYLWRSLDPVPVQY